MKLYGLNKLAKIQLVVLNQVNDMNELDPLIAIFNLPQQFS